MTGPTHFKGKDALGHVIEAQAQGIITATEVHGVEPPGHLSSMADATRETAIILPIIWAILNFLQTPSNEIIVLLLIFSCGWMLWKLGRSAWFGWFRLERLHRVLDQERFEIEHHRQQERDELRELYAAKGFEGKLLEDVLDVLMADNDRLLKVMVEEELGLTLAAYEHPLKQGLGAAAGVIFSTFLCILTFALWPPMGIFMGALIALWASAAFAAKMAQNNIIPAVIWNLGIASLAFGCVYFLLQWLTGK